MKRITKALAYHEAGHVVARHYTGAGTFGVEARRDGTGIAFGSGNLFRSRSSGQYAAWDHLVTTLAGPCAEARQSHQSVAAVLLGGGASDFREAGQSIEWLVDRGFAADDEAAWERAWRETAEFLKSEWPKIERVAAALIERECLTAGEVEALIGE